MNRLPAFLFYPGDWLSSTKIALMSPAEEGAYIRLLAHCWGDPNCSLPDDDDQLAELSRLRKAWFRGSSIRLRNCFEKHPERPGRLINHRLLKIWHEAKERQIDKASAGRKGAHARWNSADASRWQPHAPAIHLTLPNGMAGNGNSVSYQNSSSEEDKRGEDEDATPSSGEIAKLDPETEPASEPVDKPPTPEELVEQFNKIPGVQKALLIEGRVPDTIREKTMQRIRKHRTKEFWKKFFELITNSRFLTGREEPTNGRKEFHVSFSWAMGPQNFDKIAAGNYTDPPPVRKPWVPIT